MSIFKGFRNRLLGILGRDFKSVPSIYSTRALPDDYPVDYLRSDIEFSGTPEQRAMAAEASTWVMRCIDYRINEIRNVDWAILDKSGNPIEDHPFINAEKWAMTDLGQDIFERWMTMRLVHGNVYIEKLLDGRGQPGGVICFEFDEHLPRGFEWQVSSFSLQCFW